MTAHDGRCRSLVLVVEDEPLLRMAAVDMVEEADFEPVEAADATKTMRILEERLDIRIVFSDIDIPRGINGMKLAALIRNRWPPIDIILTSGHVDASEVDLLIRSMFFSKLYNEKVVVAAMKKFVG